MRTKWNMNAGLNGDRFIPTIYAAKYKLRYRSQEKGRQVQRTMHRMHVFVLFWLLS